MNTHLPEGIGSKIAIGIAAAALLGLNALTFDKAFHAYNTHRSMDKGFVSTCAAAHSDVIAAYSRFGLDAVSIGLVVCAPGEISAYTLRGVQYSVYEAVRPDSVNIPGVTSR